MSPSLEFKAKNVDQAVERASAELKLSKEDLKYEVLSYGSSGIFGLSGAKKAKIRVHLPAETAPTEPKLEKDEFDRKSSKVSSRWAPSDAGDLDGDYTADRKNLGDRVLHSFPADPIEVGRLVLQRIVDSITTEAEITVEENSDRLIFNVNGGNAGILIGKRGQTLAAIQTVVEKVVNKHNESRLRVLVDIEGYLDMRKENLQKMAVRLAEKATSSGKPISLSPMNAYERRIVHLALQDFSDVQTRSRGEGPLRKLVIFPKKKSFSRKQPLA